MNPAHPAAIISVLIPPFQLLTALTQQSTAALSANASAIGIHSSLFPPPILSPLPSSIRLRAIRAYAPFGEIVHHRPAVIALVGDDLARPLRADSPGHFAVIRLHHHCRDALAAIAHPLLDRL